MAITFVQEKKLQRILMVVLGAVVLITTTVLWFGFFKQPAMEEDVTAPPVRKVEIKASVLADPVLKALAEPRAPAQIPSIIGRDNPFLRYEP